MDKHQGQQGVIHVRSDLVGTGDGGFPIGGGYSIEDRQVQCIDSWVGVGLEKAVVDLTEHIADGFGFIRQLHRERGLEVRDQLGDKIGLKGLNVRESKEDAHILKSCQLILKSS